MMNNIFEKMCEEHLVTYFKILKKLSCETEENFENRNQHSWLFSIPSNNANLSTLTFYSINKIYKKNIKDNEKRN